jgi:putative PIN family toxin of toxin-antitoxin system
MTRRRRVFLDTNVIFSALYASVGAPNAILEAYLRGQIEVVVSRQVLEELVRTVRQKRPQLVTRLYFFLQQAPFEVQPDPSPDEVTRWEQVIHSADAPILAAAIAARPDFLITGNKRHFTSEVATLAGLEILSPSEFVEILTGQDRGEHLC